MREVWQLRRNLPLSLALSTSLVIGLYLLANLAYLIVLPFADIQGAEKDRAALTDRQREDSLTL